MTDQPLLPEHVTEKPTDSASECPKTNADKPIFTITGLSGAGKSTVLHVFEDMRLFTADGVPPELIFEMVRLLQSFFVEPSHGIALGFDQRRSEFMAELDQALHRLSSMGFRAKIPYLEAGPAVIMRRYATTRRPHPFEREGVGLEQTAREEMERLAPVREIADKVIGTSFFSIHDLRRIIQCKWNSTLGRFHTIKVNLISFGFKYGTPREAGLVFDLRFLPNPYFVEELRPQTGKESAIVEYASSESPGKELKERLIDLLSFLLPLYDAEGYYRITIALGCTGGKHRSVVMTETLIRALKRQDCAVSVEHRHMEFG